GLIGATAMAGAVGAGGLGDLALRYGYQQWDIEVMIMTVIILICLVQAIQSLGNWAAKKLKKTA
ncbi:metal ABC transporter permease, partial [Anoxybacillus sp. LAT_38]|nr:metal ABC transporter permease [Anoxybacillus sp. LAT_38]